MHREKTRQELKANSTQRTSPAFIGASTFDKSNSLRISHNELLKSKKTQSKLDESDSKYRILVEKSLQGIMIAKYNPLRLVFANESMGKMVGYSPEELIALSSSEIAALIFQEDRKVFFDRFVCRLEGKQGDSNHEFRAVRKDGSIIWMESFSTLIEYDGQPALQAMFLDINERKKAEDRVRKSEMRFRELANFLPEIVFESDLSGKITFFNQRAFEITGYMREELEKGLNIMQFVVSEQREKAKENIEKSIAGINNTSEYTLLKKNGTTFAALVRTASIISEGEVKGLRGIVMDISERRKDEERVRLSEEKYRNLFENASDVIVTFDLSGKITSANKAIMQYGFKENEAIGNSIFTLVPKEYSETMISGLKNIAAGNVAHNEIEILTPIGKKSIEYNSSPTWLNGKVIGYQTIIRDVTERKQMEKKLEAYSKHLEELIETRTKELRETQQQLVKSERLAAIGELAGLVGHDLRNPLASIKNATYYLKKKGIAIPEAQEKEMLGIIEKSIDHSDKIINELLEYASELRLELGEASTRSLLITALKTIQVPDKIHIVDNTCDKPTFSVDLKKIEHVFINIINNSLDAMPNGGTLEIRSSQTGANVEICFSDTGTGIPEEVLPKIFLPLFTTKAQGMGFGLAICKRVVTAHGGKILVETIMGKGTTFTVILPVEPKIESATEKF
ncbi:MAG: PAS domain S-box protein [Candidatus Bathyarchaeia archaeon]